LTIPPVKEQLTLLVLYDNTCGRTRLALRIVERCHSAVALTANTPMGAAWNNALVLAHGRS
jgi:hypothetical protein